MIKAEEYPEFEKGYIPSYYKTLKKSEREIIDSFLVKVGGTAGKRRLEETKRVITQFRKVIHKDFDKLTLEDLREYLALLNKSKKTRATKNDLKSTIKRFLKWKFKDWSERFDELKDIKITLGMNEEKINADTLISKEEIEKLMKAERSLYWRTAFITAYESGLRPNELRHLRWEKIKFNVEGDLSEINIFATKTHKARSVFVKEATKYLYELKNKSESDWVFPTKRNKDKPMNRSDFSIWLHRRSKEVLGREVFPYLLRHSRATELYINAGISPKISQKFLGHKKDMSDVYTHMSNKDVKEAVGKTIYKFDEMPEEKKHELEKELDGVKGRLKEYDEIWRLLKNSVVKTLPKNDSARVRLIGIK